MENHVVDRYPVEIWWSDDDEAFIAEVCDLPGCLADGSTEVEAINAAHEVARMWLETATAERRAIPEPLTAENASGKFNVRLPSSLHRELQKRARREGVSLNQLVVMLLAHG